MLKGFVNGLDEPLITITLLSHGNRAHSHRVVIDTGFNGTLSLPEKVAKRYGWQWVGYESYEVATGAVVQEKVFLGKIRWFGRAQDVAAVASHAKDILIGTKLLRRSKLWIDFPKRKLTIEHP